MATKDDQRPSKGVYSSNKLSELRQISGYTFSFDNVDVAPIIHSTYEDTFVSGFRHNPLPSLYAVHEALHVANVVARPGTTKLGNNNGTSIFAINSTTSSKKDTIEATFKIPVIARVSSHVLRLQREFQLALKLQKDVDPECSHIIRVLDLIHLTPSGFVVSIFESPGHVNDLLVYLESFAKTKAQGALPEPQVPREHESIMPLHLFLTFAIGACECLEILHSSSNSIHGELRGDAFFFNRKSGAVKLINFGSGARSFEGALNAAVWEEVQKQQGIADKLMYIAPEQTRRMSHNPDSRTDIYSLGVLFYILLTRKQPFEATEPMDIIQSVLSRKIPLVNSARMDIPEALSHIIHKMTSKQVDKRYYSATGLKSDLKHLQTYLASGDLESLAAFSLGTKDTMSFFRLPSILVGRVAEHEKIVQIIHKSALNHRRSGAAKDGVYDINSNSIEPGESSSALNSFESGSHHSSEGYKLSSAEGAPGSLVRKVSVMSTTRDTESGEPASMTVPTSTSENRFSSMKNSAMNSSRKFEYSSRGKNTTSTGSTNSGNEQSNQRFRRRGRCQVVAISGAGGLGKSSLAASVQTEARRAGYFASAKFDRAQQQPYGAILQVISSLFKQMLTESDDVIGEMSYNVRAFLKSHWISLHKVLDLPDLTYVFRDEGNLSTSKVSGHTTYASKAATMQTSTDIAHAGSEHQEDLLSSVMALENLPMHDQFRSIDANLASIDETSSAAIPSDSIESSGVKMRFFSMMLEVLRVLSATKFLCLCLDDLQFADEESMDLLTAIVSSKIRLMIIVTYRNTDITTERVRSILESDRSNITTIELSPLTEENARVFVAETTHQTLELVRPLATVIMDNTQGNPFYMREMLTMCFQRRAIRYNWKTSAWTYDIDHIFRLCQSEYKGGFNHGDLIIKRFQDLPSRDVRVLLAWASLIGTTFKFSSLKKLLVNNMDAIAFNNEEGTENRDHNTSQADRFVEALQSTLETGLVVSTSDEDTFRFAHDRYIQAANAIKEASKLPEMHLAIAQLMMEEQDQYENYDIAYHMCQAVDLIKAQFVERAVYRYVIHKAAASASNKGAHVASLDLYKNAIKLLQDKPWSDGQDRLYTETLQLYSGAAESIWHQGGSKINDALGFIEAVLEHGRTTIDTIPSWILRSRVFMQSRNMIEASETLGNCLKLLGSEIPSDLNWETLDQEFLEIRGRVQSSNFDQLALQALTEDKMISALGVVLMEATVAAYSHSMTLFAKLTFMLIDLHLSKGQYVEVGCAYFNIAAIGIVRFRDTTFASQAAELGTKLLDAYGDDTITNGRGIILYMTFISHLEVHVSNAVAGLTTALEYAVSAGDRVFIPFALAHCAAFKFQSSHDLHEIEEYCKYATEELSNWSEAEEDPGMLLVAVRQTSRALRGETNTSSAKNVLSDNCHDSARFLESIKNNTWTLTVYKTFQLVALYMYGHLDEAAWAGGYCLQSLDLHAGQRYTRMMLFYYSLTLLARLRNDPNRSNFRSIIEDVERYKTLITDWMALCDVNYRTWVEILNAEICDLQGQHLEAGRIYETALNFAQQNEFIFEAALACELAGECYLRQGIKKVANNFLKEASTTYIQLGATGKAQELMNRHNKQLKTHNVRMQDSSCQTDFLAMHSHLGDLHNDQNGEAGQLEDDLSWIPPRKEDRVDLEDPKSVAKNSLLSPITLDTLDLNAIINSSQVISSEVELDALLSKMCQLVLDNMGSQADLVSIIVKEDEQYLAAAVGDLDDGVTTHKPGKPLKAKDASDISPAVVLYIIRTHETLFIQNVNEDERFCSPEWNAKNPQGKSILGLPIVNNRSELVGVLYLEGHSFTDRNLVVLSYLTTQIGISITNALLFKSVKAVSLTNYAMIESLNNALAKAKESKARAKESQAQAEAAKEEALQEMRLKEEASRAKSEFLANVSHELRTPLSGVLGISELLRGTILTPEQEDMTDSMRKCADTLLTVINDILDFSKIEAGKMKLISVPFYLKDNIASVVRALSYTNLEKNVKIFFQCDVDQDLIILGDLSRIQQVVMNLLSNAFKFCTSGSITVRISLDDKTEDFADYTVSVIDTGIGVDDETLKKLFKPFSQADSSSGKKHGGTGLGLSICKSLIENMGGSIGMTSKLGEGTTVFFKLQLPIAPQDTVPYDDTLTPLDPDPMATYNRKQVERTHSSNQRIEQAARTHASQDLGSISKEDLKILLVEDNPINQKIATSFIKRLQFHVEVAENGQLAVDMLRARAIEGRPFHLVLMDIQMPVMDGYTACEMIRKDDMSEVRDVVVIAMTASAIQGDREKCLKVGMHDYLAKPVRALVLGEMIHKYLRPPPKQTMAPHDLTKVTRQIVAGATSLDSPSIPSVSETDE